VQTFEEIPSFRERILMVNEDEAVPMYVMSCYSSLTHHSSFTRSHYCCRSHMPSQCISYIYIIYIDRVLVANKCDLESERKVSKEEGAKLAEEYGNIPFIEVSALKAINCDRVFHEAVRGIRYTTILHYYHT
jgi:hypothetical protein